MAVDVQQLYEEISSDEGKVLHAYLCSESHKTVGIGHKVLATDAENTLPIHGINDDVPDGECISEARCYELFQEDVQIAIDGCRKIYDNYTVQLLTRWDVLPQEAQHILVNMCFQLGQGGLSKFKNMNSAVEDGEWSRMSEEMMDSRWARQTPERAERLSERVLAIGD
jgi:lysozyme